VSYWLDPNMIAAEHILMLLNMVLMVIVLGLTATALGVLVDASKRIRAARRTAAPFKFCRRREGGAAPRARCDRFNIGRGLFRVQVEGTEHTVLASLTGACSWGIADIG
jgi:hypothetical protein